MHFSPTEMSNTSYGALVEERSRKRKFKELPQPQKIEFEYLGTWKNEPWIKVLKLDDYEVSLYPKGKSYRVGTGKIFELGINYLYPYSGIDCLNRRADVRILGYKGIPPEKGEKDLIKILRMNWFWPVAKPRRHNNPETGTKILVYRVVPIECLARKGEKRASLQRCRIEQGPV